MKIESMIGISRLLVGAVAVALIMQPTVVRAIVVPDDFDPAKGESPPQKPGKPAVRPGARPEPNSKSDPGPERDPRQGLEPDPGQDPKQDSNQDRESGAPEASQEQGNSKVRSRANPESAPAASEDEKAKAAPGQATSSDSEKPPPLRHWTIKAAYGMGMAEMPVTSLDHYEIGFSYDLNKWIGFGAYYRKQRAKYDDKIYFSSTGYTETRTYEIAADVIGPSLILKPFGSLVLTFAVGLSKSVSQLSSVTTDAPIPSTFSFSGETNYCLATRAEADLQYTLGQSILYGVGIGYSSSASGNRADVKETFASAILGVRF